MGKGHIVGGLEIALKNLNSQFFFFTSIGLCEGSKILKATTFMS